MSRVGAVYVAVEEGGPSKIGVAVEPEVRVKVIARTCKVPMRLVWSAERPDCHRVETLVRRLLAKRLHKTFRPAGHGEWFDLPAEKVVAAAQRAIRILDTGDTEAMRKLKAPWLKHERSGTR